MNVHDPKVKRATPSNTEPGSGVRGSDSDERAGSPGHGASVGRVEDREKTGPGARTPGLRLLLMALLPLLVVAIGYGLKTYLVSTKVVTAKRPQTERAFSVISTVVQAQTYQPNLKLFGATVTGRQVDIRALVSGRVVETSGQLREGGEISKGEMLLRIDPFNFENTVAVARAQHVEALARLREFRASVASDTVSLGYAREQTKLSQKDLERARPLAGRGAVSRRTVDDRQQVVLQRQQAADLIANNIKVWNTRIAQQEATIVRLKAALDLANRRFEETRLVAPFNAFVSGVSSQVGRMVGANDKVATLIDRDWIEARFTITDEQFGRIVSSEGSLIGREVSVDWVLGGVTFSYTGKVERLGAQVSSLTGGIEVFARLNTPGEPVAIRPGAFVEIKIPDTKFEKVFRLASTSLYSGDTVFVIKDDRLLARNVKVVGGFDSDLLVRGELKSGERVLVTRISTPGDGVLVKEVEPL